MTDAEEPIREGDAAAPADAHAPETHVTETHGTETNAPETLAADTQPGADELAETAERIARIEAMPLEARAGAYGELADELRRALENADPASS